MSSILGKICLAVCLFSAAPAFAGDDAVLTLPRDTIVAEPHLLPSEGHLVSGQPTTAVLDAISASGYVAVIDMRGPNEKRGMDEAAEVASRGMTYISLPVTSTADLSFENASKLDEVLAEFDGPVFLHCGRGNRVGAIYALRERQNGASVEEAMETGKAAGLTKLEGQVREVLEESE